MANKDLLFIIIVLLLLIALFIRTIYRVQKVPTSIGEFKPYIYYEIGTVGEVNGIPHIVTLSTHNARKGDCNKCPFFTKSKCLHMRCMYPGKPDTYYKRL